MQKHKQTYVHWKLGSADFDKFPNQKEPYRKADLSFKFIKKINKLNQANQDHRENTLQNIFNLGATRGSSEKVCSHVIADRFLCQSSWDQFV